MLLAHCSTSSGVFQGFLHIGTVTLTALVSKLAPKHMRSTVMGVVYALALVPKSFAPTLGGQLEENYNSDFFAAIKLNMPGPATQIYPSVGAFMH